MASPATNWATTPLPAVKYAFGPNPADASIEGSYATDSGATGSLYNAKPTSEQQAAIGTYLGQQQQQKQQQQYAPSVQSMMTGGRSSSSSSSSVTAGAAPPDPHVTAATLMNQIPQVLASVGATNPPAAQLADASGARAAAFARAKDKAGELARASLMAMREVGAERGAYVAGGENPSLASGEADIINQAQGNLGDVTRQHAIADSDAAQHVADLNYAGEQQNYAKKMDLARSVMSMLGSLY